MPENSSRNEAGRPSPAPERAIENGGRYQAPNHYAAYCLGIRSSLALPELTPVPDGSDVVIRAGAVEGVPPDGPPTRVLHRSTADETRLFLDGVGKLLVRAGEEIVVDAAPGIAPGTLRAFLLGPGVATLLAQRGLFVLHASAVEVGAGAVAFVGGSGWGKSTTAAALHARGHALVADDVLALDLGSDTVRALPGFPQLKLWGETAAHLGAPADGWMQYNPALDKGFQAAGRVIASPLPLDAVYVLDDGDDVAFEPLSCGQAVIELVRHSWAAGILRATAPRRHFESCSSVAERVPLVRVCRPQVLERLADVVDAIERRPSRSEG